tara:strand:- start:522 stop:1898 length:1377 start_codon:yes stop_codon:yes gene_type:complete
MCDTMVARPQATKSGALLFAKNSDRGANEAQYLQHVPRMTYASGATLACTYISIPQVAETHAVLLSRPFWIWGAEMGTNEHGLIIGNEAVYSKIAPQSEEALLGMDLLRLGLERAATADEAVRVITSLLEQFGQGGNCGHIGRFEYHNSFLIADAQGDAFVLETVGRDWALERVDLRRTISNAYSIGTNITRASQGLVAQAVSHGFVADGAAFNFTDAYAPPKRTRFASGATRYCRSTALMERHSRQSPATMMEILRDRGPRAGREKEWRPDGAMGGTICAHASWGPVRRHGQTTASWVAELGTGRSVPRSVHWVTGTSAPDTSIFKPVFFGPGFEGAALPDFGPVPGDTFDPATRWWAHEQLHRAVLEDYAPRLAAYAGARDRLEASFIARVEALLARGGTAEEAGALSRAIWREADMAERSWLEQVQAIPVRPRHQPSHLYRMHWAKLARLAKMPA